MRVQGSGNGTSYVFKICPPGKPSFEVTIGIGIIETSAAGKELAEAFTRRISDMAAFKEYLTARSAQLETEMQHDQNGWAEDGSFIIGRSAFKDGVREPANVGLEMDRYAGKLTPKGSHALWTDAATMLLKGGIPLQQFTILASFASPLMRFLSPQEGGAIISLTSQGSGRGKSTALHAAASVWGDIEALALSATDTVLSRQAMYGRANHLPNFFDEVRFKDRDETVDFVNVYSRSQERKRLSTAGRLLRDNESWHNLLITTGNKSFWDLLSSNSNDPPSLRVLEFPADDLPATVQGASSLYATTFHENYGWAGSAFLALITDPPVKQAMLKRLLDAEDEIKKRFGFTFSHRFWTRTLAACEAAATILNQMQFLQLDWRPSVQWAGEQMQKSTLYQAGRQDKEALASDAMDFFGRFFNRHQQDHGPTARTVIWRPVYGGGSRQVQFMVVDRREFEGELMEEGYNVNEALEALRVKGILLRKEWSSLTDGGVKVKTLYFKMPGGGPRLVVDNSESEPKSQQ